MLKGLYLLSERIFLPKGLLEETDRVVIKSQGPGIFPGY